MIDPIMTIVIAGLITAVLLGLGPERIKTLLWYLGAIGGTMALVAFASAAANAYLASK